MNFYTVGKYKWVVQAVALISKNSSDAVPVVTNYDSGSGRKVREK